MSSKKIVKLNGWQFYNFPQQLDLNDYYLAVNTIQEQIEKVKFSGSVYISSKIQKNKMSLGFSDLDFIIVSDNIPIKIKEIFEREKYSKNIREVIYHDSLFLSKKLAEDFCIYVNNENKNWFQIYGEKKNYRQNNSIVDVDFRNWDDMIFYNYRNIYKFFLTKCIDVRSFFHRVNFINHQNSIWKQKYYSAKLKRNMVEFILESINIAKNWFDHEEKKNLLKIIILLKKSVKLLENLLVENTDYYKKKYCVDTQISQFYFKDIQFPMIFKNSRNYFVETQSNYKKYNRVVPVFPSHLFALISHYSKSESKLGRYIQKRINISPVILKDKIMKNATNRLDFYQCQIDFAAVNMINSGPLLNFRLHESNDNLLKNTKNCIKNYYNLLYFNKIIKNNVS